MTSRMRRVCLPQILVAGVWIGMVPGVDLLAQVITGEFVPVSELDLQLLEGFDPTDTQDTSPSGTEPDATSLLVARVEWADPAAATDALQQRMQRAAAELHLPTWQQAVPLQDAIIRDLEQLVAQLTAVPSEGARGQLGRSPNSDVTTAESSNTGQSGALRGGQTQSRSETAPSARDAPLSHTQDSVRPIAENLPWGELPERTVRRLQSIQQVEFVPEFRRWTADYYEALRRP